MNNHNRPNPILLQIPLVVTPGKYVPPKPVNLPYDYVNLPDVLSAEFLEDTNSTQTRLEQLLNQQNEVSDRLAYLYSGDKQSERIKPYSDWKQELNKMAPGYFGSSMSVMAPTVNNAKSVAAEDILMEDEEEPNLDQGDETEAPNYTINSVSNELSDLKIEW